MLEDRIWLNFEWRMEQILRLYYGGKTEDPITHSNLYWQLLGLREGMYVAYGMESDYYQLVDFYLDVVIGLESSLFSSSNRLYAPTCSQNDLD